MAVVWPGSSGRLHWRRLWPPRAARFARDAWVRDLLVSSATDGRDGARDHPEAGASSNGEDGRFEAFFEKHSREIFGYLWRLTGEEQAAHDLCQETFLRAWQNFARVSTYEQPRSWLFRVATNLAINHQRHRGYSSAVMQRLRIASDVGDDPASGLAERDAVRIALLKLPIRQRTALVLRAVYGLPFDEIAAILGVSIAAAKMTLSRGREQFRTHYLREDNHP